MKRLELITLLAVLLVCVFGCQPAIDREAEIAALLQADRDFSRLSFEEGVVVAFRAYLTEDALSLPNGFEPIQGIDAILEDMTGLNEGYVMVWEPKGGDVSQDADMGYTWGTYMVMKKDEEDGEPHSYGKYMNIWKRQPDGSWKAAVDMGNKSPMPETP